MRSLPLLAVIAAAPLRPAAAAPEPGLAHTTAQLAVAAAKTCSDLLSVDLVDVGGPGSRITSASQKSSRGVDTCAVEGVLAPSIGFQAQLPLRTWTGRYLQAGCGGCVDASRSRSARPTGARRSRPGAS